MNPEYLGDGVYADTDNGRVVLRLNDHRSEPIVILEPEVLRALRNYCTKHGIVF